MNNLIVFLISILFPFATNGQDSERDKYNKIDSSFINLVSQSQKSNKKLFDFEYKNGPEPNVDVIDTDFDLLLTKLEKSQILKLVSYFSNFYKQSEPDKTGKYLSNKMKSFLTHGIYSVEFNYKSINQITTNIICLIYGHGKYILFSLGY
ncbi:MAG: hypothetical protein ABJB11_23860 [Ferruginibacter sp.]